MQALIPLAISAAGALAGSLGKKSSSWSGEKVKTEKLSRLTSGQEKMLRDLLKHPNVHLPDMTRDPNYQQGSGYLQRLLSQDPEMMRQFEAPMMRQFNEQIVPQLAEQFSGMGARSSSAFGQQMGAAGAGLAERIAQMRGQLGLGAAGQALSYAQTPFQQKYAQEGLNLNRMQLGLGTPAFGYMSTGGTPGLGSGISSALLQGGGGMMGAGGGSGFMSGLGSLWSKLFGGGNNSIIYPSDNNLG